MPQRSYSRKSAKGDKHPRHKHKKDKTKSTHKHAKKGKSKICKSRSKSKSKCQKDLGSAFTYVYALGSTGNTGQVLAGCSAGGATILQSLVNFTNQGPTKNVTVLSSNSLVVQVPGIYEAQYTVNTTAGNTSSEEDGTAVTSFKLLKNGLVIPGSVYATHLGDELVGQAKFVACPGDVIQLANNGTSSVALQGSSTITNLLSPRIGAFGGTGSNNSSTGTITAPTINIVAGSSIYVALQSTGSLTGATVTGNGGTISFTQAVNVGAVAIFYADNLPGGPITVTATQPSSTINLGIEVVEVQNTGLVGPAGSLDSVNVVGGTSSIDITSTAPNELGFMSIRATNSSGSTQPTISGTTSTFLLNQVIVETNTPQSGADLYQNLVNPGIHTMTAGVTAADFMDIAAVSIRGQSQTLQLTCEIPVVASLDLKLLIANPCVCPVAPCCKCKAKKCCK